MIPIYIGPTIVDHCLELYLPIKYYSWNLHMELFVHCVVLLCCLKLSLTSMIPFPKENIFPLCEAFLHTFNMKICTHKTRLEVELLCSCSLTSKVVQCNVMKFIKNLMHYVHLEDTKTLWENHNSP